MVTCGTYVASVFIFCPHVCLRTKGRMIRLHCCHWDLFLFCFFYSEGAWFLLEGSAPHMPPMLIKQESISVQFYCSLGMCGWKKCLIFGGCDLTLPFCPLLLSSDWGFDYFWLKKKKKDRNKLCKCTQRCTKCLYILLLVHCCCRRQWWWFIFSFNVIYDYIWIYE